MFWFAGDRQSDW